MSMGQQELTVETAASGKPLSVTIYEHSPIFYWWPVWVTGFLMAILTGLYGTKYNFEEARVATDEERQAVAQGEAAVGEASVTRMGRIHPNENLGVIFTMVLVLVFLVTNISVRGMASALVIATIIIVTLFLAYMEWWGYLLRRFDNLTIYMNLGFYVTFSTIVFVVWGFTFFVFDRFTSWTFRPGQVVYSRLWGGAERTFDTYGASVYKKRDDLFRHWVLGLGTGDIYLATTGAEARSFDIRNVILVGTRLNEIQKLVAMKPDDATDFTGVLSGEPE